ncbi:MAG: hypothetical protein ACPLRZ_10430 [Thermovenabulum sp.]|uniref:hypothetical protein n=1 Tax=Thermovenabulum sp. TaxID=3100335 RepID=UPI003C7E14D9
MTWNFKFKYFRFKKIIGYITVGFGISLFIVFLPHWIWMLFFGALLIWFGINVINN